MMKNEMVAGVRFELTISGHEPEVLPLHYPAMFGQVDIIS